MSIEYVLLFGVIVLLLAVRGIAIGARKKRERQKWARQKWAGPRIEDDD